MPAAASLPLDSQTEEKLQFLARAGTAAEREVQRANIVLELAAGTARQRIAEQLEVARQMVSRWEQCFRQRIDGLQAAARSGRPVRITPEKTVEVVRKTTQETPAESTHWTTRGLAKEAGVGKASVSRTWREHKVQPYRVRRLKLSNDPESGKKTRDVTCRRVCVLAQARARGEIRLP